MSRQTKIFLRIFLLALLSFLSAAASLKQLIFGPWKEERATIVEALPHVHRKEVGKTGQLSYRPYLYVDVVYEFQADASTYRGRYTSSEEESGKDYEFKCPNQFCDSFLESKFAIGQNVPIFYLKSKPENSFAFHKPVIAKILLARICLIFCVLSFFYIVLLCATGRKSRVSK